MGQLILLFSFTVSLLLICCSLKVLYVLQYISQSTGLSLQIVLWAKFVEVVPPAASLIKQQKEISEKKEQKILTCTLY